MGICQELVSHDELFRTKVKGQPFIVNDMDISSEKEKEAFNGLIYTKYSTDLLSNLPTCECGEIKGEYNVGVVCKECGTQVRPQIEQELEPLIWIRTPRGVTKLMNPIVWTMLKSKFTRSGFEVIRWLCDTTYKPQVKTPPVMELVMRLGITRGYNNFVQNFDSIIRQLFDLKAFRPKGAGEDPLYTLIREYRKCVFSDYIPVPNRALLVIEETNVGTYVDPTVTGAVDAVRMLAAIDSPASNHSTRVKENRTVKMIAQLSEYHENIARDTLAKKEGIFRKHIYGGRCQFSFRAVISSLTDAHDYDELHIPWGIGASVLRIHLLNKLMRRGYSDNAAIGFLNHYAQTYHPLLDELFQQLIMESKQKGIPCVFQRNPSLERGSAQSMFITKVKSDPSIPTVSLSILAVRGFNADSFMLN